MRGIIKVIQTYDVVKYYRFYKGYPIIEIHYEKLKALWWEDFFENAETNVVLSLFKHQPMICNDWKRTSSELEKNCKHNFGDCFIAAPGKNAEKFMYKGFFIYCTHTTKTGKGIGSIFYNNVPLHDAWKIWWSDRKIPNIESSLGIEAIPVAGFLCMKMAQMAWTKWL